MNFDRLKQKIQKNCGSLFPYFSCQNTKHILAQKYFWAHLEQSSYLMVFPYPLTTQSSPQWSAVPFNDAAPSFGMTIANHLGKTTKNLGQIIVNVNLLEEYLSQQNEYCQIQYTYCQPNIYTGKNCKCLHELVSIQTYNTSDQYEYWMSQYL